MNTGSYRESDAAYFTSFRASGRHDARRLRHHGQQLATLPQPNTSLQTAALTPPPAQQIASAQAMTDITAFIDPAAVGQLSAKEKAEASSAQFNALQFGRPGAPRSWQGDRGASGQVTVGPYVRVNNIDCRDFTHTVTVSGKEFARTGTACREFDGRWSVAG